MVQVITADYSNLNLRGIHADFWRGFPDVTGKRVFIKPNLVCPATNYDYWSTTRVEVVEMVIKKIKRGNPSEIIIGECGFKGQWQNTIKSTGYDRLADIPGVRLVALQDGENYHKFTLQRLPEGMYRSLFGVKFSDYLLESDVVINIQMKILPVSPDPRTMVRWSKGNVWEIFQRNLISPQCLYDGVYVANMRSNLVFLLTGVLFPVQQRKWMWRLRLMGVKPL